MISRRLTLTGGAAALLAGCTQSQATPQALPVLKGLAPYDLGVCVKTHDLKDSIWQSLAATHFDRITSEWEMKMEYMLKPDGSLRFDAPDRLVAMARSPGLTTFGHTLIWYAQDGDHFQALKSEKLAFHKAYGAYIKAVAGHFRGRLSGWDVVNEPVTDDGAQLRTCLWSEVLGTDYIAIAFGHAHAADPDVPLFLNDYNLEYNPKKRATFLKLAEDLLKKGVPLHGLGTQTHIAADIEKGVFKTALNDIASLGLKVHVSEVDISLKEAKLNAFNGSDLRLKQARALEEIAQSYGDLKPEQQFGLTIWGLMDKDSWLNFKNGQPVPGNKDAPLLFDDNGHPKDLAHAFASSLG